MSSTTTYLSDVPMEGFYQIPRSSLTDELKEVRQERKSSNHSRSKPLVMSSRSRISRIKEEEYEYTLPTSDRMSNRQELINLQFAKYKESEASARLRVIANDSNANGMMPARELELNSNSDQM